MRLTVVLLVVFQTGLCESLVDLTRFRVAAVCTRRFGAAVVAAATTAGEILEILVRSFCWWNGVVEVFLERWYCRVSVSVCSDLIVTYGNR